jgi:hypothetical protein
MSIYMRNILRFIALILIQVLLLNNLLLNIVNESSGIPSISPFIYPIFILLLPLSTPTWAMLLIGFFTGITVDVFMNTGGMHAAVCVFIAAIRNSILTALLPQRLSDYPNLSPGIKNMRWAPFLTYSAALIFIHHLCYYMIEIWSIKEIGYLMIKTFTSFVTSMIFIVIYSLLFSQSSGSNSLSE